MSRRALLAAGGVVVALVAVRALAIGILLAGDIDGTYSILGGDARRYLDILAAPGTPYRDSPVEYPPLTLAFTWLIRGTDLFATQVHLALSQLALELAAAAAIAWGWGRRAGIAYLLLGAPMALYPFPYFRVDLLSVLLAVVALALVARRWPLAGGAVLGVAGFAKIWPVVLAPVLLLRRRWDGLAAFGLVLAVGGLGWVLWAGWDGPMQVASFRGARGWQIESIGGIFVHMAEPARTWVEQGAWRTGRAVPGVLRIGLPALALGTAAGAWLLAERSRRRSAPGADLAVDGWAPLASVLGLLVFSSIISPQYLVWATPFAAIVAARSSKALGAVFMACGTLSALGLLHIHALTRGELWAELIIVARNATLVAMLAMAGYALVRTAQSAPSNVDAPSGPQVTPKAMMATISESDATRSIDDVRSGMP